MGLLQDYFSSPPESPNICFHPHGNPVILASISMGFPSSFSQCRPLVQLCWKSKSMPVRHRLNVCICVTVCMNCILHILSGIRQRLDHLKYLGVDAVLLSSFYDSPFEHLGRDVRDFIAVGTKYGSMEDFELLVADLHRLGNVFCSQLICKVVICFYLVLFLIVCGSL